jgi:hypothetical protein
MSVQSATRSIIESIISPKIVGDGNGGYVAKTDIVNVDTLTANVLSGSFSSQQCGKAVLSSGTKQVLNNKITGNSVILLTPDVNDESPSGYYGVNLDIGSGFTIHSSNQYDTSTVNWFVAKY